MTSGRRSKALRRAQARHGDFYTDGGNPDPSSPFYVDTSSHGNHGRAVKETILAAPLKTWTEVPGTPIQVYVTQRPTYSVDEPWVLPIPAPIFIDDLTDET